MTQEFYAFYSFKRNENHMSKVSCMQIFTVTEQYDIFLMYQGGVKFAKIGICVALFRVLKLVST